MSNKWKQLVKSANIALKSENYDKASKYLTQAVRKAERLNPNYLQYTYLLLAETLKRAKRFEEQEVALRNALPLISQESGEDSLEFISVSNNFGLALKEIGKIDEAVAVLEKTVISIEKFRGKPEFNLRPHINLANAYIHQNKLIEAEEILRTVYKIQKTEFETAPFDLADTIWALHKLCILNQKYEDSKKFNSELQKFPEDILKRLEKNVNQSSYKSSTYKSLVLDSIEQFI